MRQLREGSAQAGPAQAVPVPAIRAAHQPAAEWDGTRWDPKKVTYDLLRHWTSFSILSRVAALTSFIP